VKVSQLPSINHKKTRRIQAKKIPVCLKADRDWKAFLLSHAKAPLREEKRDAIAKHWQ